MKQKKEEPIQRGRHNKINRKRTEKYRQHREIERWRLKIVQRGNTLKNKEAEIYRREAQNSKEKARNRTEGKAHKVLQKGKNKNESETKRKTEKQLREGSAEKKGAKNQVVDREQYKKN